MRSFSLINWSLAVLVAWGHASSCSAQHLSGSIPAASAADGWIRLWVSRGSSQRVFDSVVVSLAGRFDFKERTFPMGFYHLAINDTDRVDIILNPDERDVELAFSGVPLQRHITVKRSEENKRLWEYKLVSKGAQAIHANALAEKEALQGMDTARLRELDSIGARAVSLREEHLQGIISGFPNSYFAKVLRADRGVEEARNKNPLAVLKAFDFSDPSLMRSSVYDEAVMTFLKNIHAASEGQFVSASDSLMVYAGQDPECKAYMLDHLIDLFATFGPELPLQHLIDRYVVDPKGMTVLDPSLHAKVAGILEVGVGAFAPDVALPTEGAPLSLKSVVERNRYTTLLFYSSTCEHCLAELPVLKEVYSAFQPKGLEIIGIALDPDTLDFRRTIELMDVPWACYSEFNGWGSSVAKAFQVRATPWLYLLDQRMRIVAKPVDVVALGLWLQENMK